MKWSALNNSFFYPDDMDFYLKAGWDLSDCIDVDESIFEEFKYSKPGLQRGVGEDGMPRWEDVPSPPSPSLDECIAQADATKSALQREAEDAIKPLERAKSLGIATPTELTLLTEWEKYSVYLMRVDTSKPDQIVWPTKPQ
ncbi:MAG: tail fiber assembly protein [Plesiomonas sp.]